MAENRLNRDLETRETAKRKVTWKPPETLPSPFAQDGYDFRWVRISTLGTPDAMNTSSKLREGYEPVRATDHPEIFSSPSADERFKDNIVIGGLMLCKIPHEFTEARNEYYQGQTDAQMKSVDSSFMREGDPRMPLFADKKSNVTFGKGT
jgi:hypothetical protein